MRNLDSCHCWRCTLCPCKLRNKFLVNFRNRTILLCVPCISAVKALFFKESYKLLTKKYMEYIHEHNHEDTVQQSIVKVVKLSGFCTASLLGLFITSRSYIHAYVFPYILEWIYQYCILLKPLSYPYSQDWSECCTALCKKPTHIL